MTAPSLAATPGAETRRRDVQLSMLPISLPLQVMLVKNLAVSRGLVNGARGVVVGFEAEGRGKWWGSSPTARVRSRAPGLAYGGKG